VQHRRAPLQAPHPRQRRRLVVTQYPKNRVATDAREDFFRLALELGYGGPTTQASDDAPAAGQAAALRTELTSDEVTQLIGHLVGHAVADVPEPAPQERADVVG